MSDVQFNSFRDWIDVFHRDPMLLCLPGVILGVFLRFLLLKLKHYAVLPIYLVAIPLVFQIVLACAHMSLDEASMAYGSGWVASSNSSSDDFYKVGSQFRNAVANFFVFVVAIAAGLAALRLFQSVLGGYPATAPDVVCNGFRRRVQQLAGCCCHSA
jgi:hypothetical protein